MNVYSTPGTDEYQSRGVMSETNLVGGEGDYLNGEKVGEWKYYFQPWLGNSELFDTQVLLEFDTLVY